MNQDTKLSAQSSSSLANHPSPRHSPQHTQSSSTATDFPTSSATREAEIAKLVQQLWPRMTPFVPLAVRDCILASMQGEAPCSLGPTNPPTTTTSSQSKDDDEDATDEKNRKSMPSLSMISNLHQPTAQPLGGTGEKGGGVVLIADVSGFTSVTEDATIQGVGGVELLARSLNCYFDPIIDLLQLFSGDIIKFAGDSLVVLFTPTEEEKKEDPDHGGLQITVLRALQCGWRLATEFGSSKMQPDGTVVPIRRILADTIGNSDGNIIINNNMMGMESSFGGDVQPTSGRSSSQLNNDHDQESHQQPTTPMSPKSPISAMFPKFFENMIKHHRESPSDRCSTSGTGTASGTASTGSKKSAVTPSLPKLRSFSTRLNMVQRKKLVGKKMMNDLSDFALQWNLNAPDLRQPSSVISGSISARTRNQQNNTITLSASQKKTTTTAISLPEDMRQIKSESNLEQARHGHEHHRRVATSSLSTITAPIGDAHGTATIIDSMNASAMQSFTSNQSGYEYVGGGATTATTTTTTTTTTTVTTTKAEGEEEKGEGEGSVSIVQSSFTSSAPPPPPSLPVVSVSNNKKITASKGESFMSRLALLLRLTKRKKPEEQQQHKDSITTTISIKQQLHVDDNDDGLAPLLSLSESMAIPYSTALCRQPPSASVAVAQLSPLTDSLVAGSVLDRRQTLGSGTDSTNNDKNKSTASLHTQHSCQHHEHQHHQHQHRRSQSGNQTIDHSAYEYHHYQQNGQQKGRLSLKVMVAVGKLWAFHVGGQGNTYTAPGEGAEEGWHEEDEGGRGGVNQPLTKGTASNTAPLQVDPRWEYFIGDLPHAIPPTETSSSASSAGAQQPSKEGSVKKGLFRWDSPPKMKRERSGSLSEKKGQPPPPALFSTPSISTNERPTMVQLKMVEKYAASGKVVMSQEVFNLLNDHTTTGTGGGGKLPVASSSYLKIIKEEKDHSGDDDNREATPVAAQLLAFPVTITKTADSTPLVVGRDVNTSVRRPAGLRAQTRLQMELDILSSQPATTQWAAIQALRLHIPDPATSRIMAGQIPALNEFRVVTCVFLGFPSFNQTRTEAPLVGTPMSDKMTMMNVQAISSSYSTTNGTTDHGCVQGCSIPLKLAADVIQKAMSIYGGSLLQMRCDEKGHLCVCAFGLPGHLAEDFVFKGMQAALFIVKEMERYGERCCAGVTTGNLFCGAVGSEKRYEYTVLGDAINLSARLMVKASQIKPPSTAAAEGNNKKNASSSKEGYVLCDEATKRLFIDAIHINAPVVCDFLPLDPLKIKGKRSKVAAFLVKPVSPSLNLTRGALNTQLPWDSTCNYGLEMQQQQKGSSDGVHQKRSHHSHQQEQPMYGRQKELDIIESKIVDLVVHHKGATVLITGLPGIGKTRMVEALQESSFRGVREQCRVVMGVGYAENKSTTWFPWKRVFSQLLAQERISASGGSEKSGGGGGSLVERLAKTVPKFEQLNVALQEALGVTITSTASTTLGNSTTRTSTSNNKGTLFSPPPPPPSSSSQEHQLSVDTTITYLLAVLQQFAILRGPLVMLLEDLHYFDSASWKLLAAVGEKLVPQGLVLIVGTYRTQFANLADITFPKYTPLPTSTETSPLADTKTTTPATTTTFIPHIIHDVVSHCFYRLTSVPSTIDMELQPLSREDSMAIMASIVGIRLPLSVGELVWYRGGGYPGFTYQMGVFLAGYIQKQVDRSVELLEMNNKGGTKGGHRTHKHNTDNDEEGEEEDEYDLLDAGGGVFAATQSNRRLGTRQLEALDTKFAPNMVPGARLISAAVEHIRASVKTHKVITARIDELSPDQAACIKAASALGHVIDTDLLLALLKGAHMSGHLTKGEVEGDLEMLVRGGLLKYQYEDGDGEMVVEGREESITTASTTGTTSSSGYYCFRQQVIRGIVYDSISPDIRRNLHSVLVDILQQSGHWEDSPEVLAYHYRMSVQWGVEGIYPDKTMLAINYSEKAAMKCIQSGAGAAEAAEHLQRAQVLAGRLANAHVHSMGGESFWRPASLHSLTIPRARRACWEQLTAALCLASETSIESLTQAQMHCLYALSFLNLPQPGQLMKEKKGLWVRTWLDYTFSSLSCTGSRTSGNGGEVGIYNNDEVNVLSSEQQQYRPHQDTSQGMDSFSSLTILDQQGTTIPLYWLQIYDDSSILVDSVAAPHAASSSSSQPTTPATNNGSASQRMLEENTGEAELTGAEMREARVVLEILVTTLVLGGSGNMDIDGLKYVMMMCRMLERRGGGGRRMSAKSQFYKAWKQSGDALRYGYGVRGKRGKLWWVEEMEGRP